MQSHLDARRTIKTQRGRYASPWTVSERIEILCWRVVWWILFRPTPKHLYRWRNFLLRMFGATIRGIPFVASSTIIRSPRSLVLEDRACLGPASEIYNLATVTVRAGATVSQQAYICGGTHDFSQAEMPLVTGDIEIGQDAFIGARAFVMPGVTIGYCAVVGACAVVTRDVGAFAIVAGNPARVIGRRQIGEADND